MPLTNTRLLSLKANPIPGKHADRDGLYLKITKTGGMYWQWRLRTPRETVVSYGNFPAVGLAEARQRHDKAKALRRDGIDPNAARRAAKVAQQFGANTFESVAREWLATRRDQWAPSYAEKILARLQNDVFPQIGRIDVGDIQPPALLVLLRKIEARGAIETAHRALENVGQVLRYAVITGRILSDPARDLKGALKKPAVRHMAAITDLKELSALLRAIDGYAGTYIVRAALQLSPMLMLRPGELRFAQWSEIDLDNALWTIPAVRMKRQRQGKLTGEPHLVPLPRQAVAVFRELHKLTGPSGMVFRGERDHERAMSENTINAALRRMGYSTSAQVTAHGFRATARTILDEHLGWNKDVIEAQLAHAVSDSLGRAYNRTEFRVQRAKMLQAWADYLDGLRVGHNVVAVDFTRAA